MICYRSSPGSGGGGEPLTPEQEENVIHSCKVSFGGVWYDSTIEPPDSISKSTFNQPIVIGNNVRNCQTLLSDFRSFNQPIIIPENVTDCSYMFSGCNNFNQSVVIPENVMNCNHMFDASYENTGGIVTINGIVDRFKPGFEYTTNCRYMFLFWDRDSSCKQLEVRFNYQDSTNKDRFISDAFVGVTFTPGEAHVMGGEAYNNQYNLKIYYTGV